MGKTSLLDLEEEGVSFGLKGLKILIYGSNNLGKTPQSMAFPKPLLIMGEAGGTALKGHKVSVKKKRDFVDYVDQLTNEDTLAKTQEKFQTIVIDTATDIVELYQKAVANEYGVKDVSEMNADSKMPNGYSLYRNAFKEDINRLCSCGYTVIFIMHEEFVELKDYGVVKGKAGFVGNGTFKVVPKGSSSVKDSARFIRDMCDFRFYIKGNGVDENGRTIMSTAYAHETEEYYAGSRFDIVPVINPFTAENIIKAIEDAQKKSAENYGANLVEYSKANITEYTREDYLKDIEPFVNALWTVCPTEVQQIIAKYLGDTPITKATEHQLNELEGIYNDLVSLAHKRNVTVVK